MQADEAKSQLQIHGHFTSDRTGAVKIEDTVVSVRSWSDTLLICDLPDNGKGSGGHVQVSQMQGESNVRLLSIFQLHIISNVFVYEGKLGWELIGANVWNNVWRIDLGKSIYRDSVVRFELSKSSSFAFDQAYPTHWIDSSHDSNYTFSFFGSVNLAQNELQGCVAKFFNSNMGGSFHLGLYLVRFDSSGSIKGYEDQGESATYKKWDDVISGRILFPPFPKDAVRPTDNSPANNMLIRSSADNEALLIRCYEIPGPVETSLYSVDGRLLRRENIVMNSSGEYRFDISGLNHGMGILVLSASKGIITKKVIF
jgi:hypothetical protein